MPKVFIVSNGGHDFSKATYLGELVFLSSGILNKYQVTEMSRQFTDLMKNSSPDDYIIPNGPTIMSALACSIFAFKHGRLNLLIWRKETSNDSDHYERRTVVLQKE